VTLRNRCDATESSVRRFRRLRWDGEGRAGCRRRGRPHPGSVSATLSARRWPLLRAVPGSARRPCRRSRRKNQVGGVPRPASMRTAERGGRQPSTGPQGNGSSGRRSKSSAVLTGSSSFSDASVMPASGLRCALSEFFASPGPGGAAGARRRRGVQIRRREHLALTARRHRTRSNGPKARTSAPGHSDPSWRGADRHRIPLHRPLKEGA